MVGSLLQKPLTLREVVAQCYMKEWLDVEAKAVIQSGVVRCALPYSLSIFLSLTMYSLFPTSPNTKLIIGGKMYETTDGCTLPLKIILEYVRRTFVDSCKPTQSISNSSLFLTPSNEEKPIGLKISSPKSTLMRNFFLSSCGGINPYTLTARLESGGLTHYETSSSLDPIARSFAQGNKTWRSSRILVG